MGKKEISQFLTHLAIAKNVSAGTQNQALNALVFLYRHILEIPLEGIDAVRAKEPKNLPVVLSVPEMKKVLEPQQGDTGVAIKMLYGCGLRVNECLRLRVKDIDLDAKVVRVHRGKGAKDRILNFPNTLVEEMKAQLAAARILYDQDQENNVASVYMPNAYDSKSPKAGAQRLLLLDAPPKTPLAPLVPPRSSLVFVSNPSHLLSFASASHPRCLFVLYC